MFSISFISSLDGLWSISLYAHDKTLNASLAIFSLCCLIVLAYSSISSFTSPFSKYELHLFNNSSTPPFVYTIYFPFISFTVVISFLSESNGISSTRGILSYIDGSKSSLKAISTKAVSVGSPVSSPSFPIFVSLQSMLEYTNLLISSLISFISDKLNVFLFINIFSTVILFCVKVPVLSEQITVALPNVSTAGNLFTIAFFFTIFCTPIAKTIVDTATSPSGIAATAKETAVINI